MKIKAHSNDKLDINNLSNILLGLSIQGYNPINIIIDIIDTIISIPVILFKVFIISF
jgi:uncharacterized protein (UPF0297 family)